MYAVGVSDHIMIAHSLRGEVFGPAQRLHGATYEVRVEVLALVLDADGIVVDIGRLTDSLKEVLAPLAFRNLDDLDEFEGATARPKCFARTCTDACAACWALAPGPSWP